MCVHLFAYTMLPLEKIHVLTNTVPPPECHVKSTRNGLVLEKDTTYY